MKKIYEKPEIEIKVFETEDVLITLSTDNSIKIIKYIYNYKELQSS